MDEHGRSRWAPDTTAALVLAHSWATGAAGYLTNFELSHHSIRAYSAREPALADGERNELSPRALALSAKAEALWVEFHNHVEAQLAEGGASAPIKDVLAVRGVEQ
jgi:hypothetical protein